MAQGVAGGKGGLGGGILGALAADGAGLVVDRRIVTGGSGFQVFCIHNFFRKVVCAQLAVFVTTGRTDCLALAGSRSAGAIDRLCGVAGAAAAMGAVAVRCPRTPIVGMFVAGLGLEHRQGSARRSQILALIVPRVGAVGAAIDQQRQHCTVAKLHGGLGAGVRDSVGIITNSFICGIQIVAVVYGGRGLLLVFARDEPYDLAIVPSLACHLTDIIAVRDCAAANISHNTAGLMVPNEYVFRKFSGIVAVADRGTAIHRSGNSANIRWNFVGSRSIRHRAIIGAVFDRTASEVTYNAAQISGITGHISGHRYIPDHRVFRGAEQAQTDLILDRRGVIYRHIHALDGMSLSVKGTGVVQGRVYGERPRICDGRPFLRRRVAGAGSIGSIRVKCTVVEDDVVRQHSARATVLRLTARTVDNIPESL